MIYLNNAASAWPKAPGVSQAMKKVLDDRPVDPGRSATSSGNILDTCRVKLARLLGVSDPLRIAFTQHATAALNLAILGMELKAGDIVVTTVTEHNSMLRPLCRLKETVGIELEIIGLNQVGKIDEDAYEKALAKKPRLGSVFKFDSGF